MKLGLAQKVVFITGASRGIGLAFARAFAAESARVAMMARDTAILESAVKELKALASADVVYASTGSAASADDIRRAMSDTVARWGKIDIVIANVGDGRSVADPMPEAERFAATWNSNFKSAELTAREAIPHLRASKGNLIFISSITGIEAFGAPTDYSVAKSAVIALSKNLARKLAPEIRVNCIAPGNVFVAGGSWDEKIQKDKVPVEKLIETTVPMRRFGKPEEIADAALFLASERAGFITGSCLVVDGGQTSALH